MKKLLTALAFLLACSPTLGHATTFGFSGVADLFGSFSGEYTTGGGFDA